MLFNSVFQLKQVEQAIKHTENIDQLNELFSLRDSLVEVIALTSETCEPEQTSQNTIDDEYALFKVILVCSIDLNVLVNQVNLYSQKSKLSLKHKIQIMMKMIRRPVKF